MPNPQTLRELRATMVLKGLKLGEVARKAKVNRTMASELLNGRRNYPERLAALIRVINTAPALKEAKV